MSDVVPSTDLFRLVASATQAVSFEWDLYTDEVRLYGSDEALRSWGLHPGAAMDGHALLDAIHPDDTRRVRRAIRNHIVGEPGDADLSHRRHHPYLGWRYVRALARSRKDVLGRAEVLVGAWFDTDGDQSQPQLGLAHRDPLTGLADRAALLSVLAPSLSSKNPEGALLVVDIDRFRSINRALGSQAGDRLLTMLAERLRETLPEHAFVARVGADQFGILLSDKQVDPETLATAIVTTLARPMTLGDHEVAPGVSIGLVRLEDATREPALAVRDAELALMRAKEGGGNRWSPFVADATRPVERLTMESRLRKAIRERDIELHFQPIVQLPSREIVAFEALARWNDPMVGNVSPGLFIPLAEETGLIIPLGNWVIDEACRVLHAWRSTVVGANIRMNINLSAAQFRQADLVQQIDAILLRYPRARGHINLELTETALLERPGDQASVLSGLRELGCQLHIDDFGTGWSSLSNLVNLPVDALKIDREFVSKCEQDIKSLAVVRTVSRMAHEMGLSVTAEGIETEGQVAIVCSMGRCSGQGYLFSRAVEEAKAFQLIGNVTTHAVYR